MTPLERQTLQRLNDLGHRASAPFGVNPCSFGGERPAACARRMAIKGWTRLSRISEHHIRYGITGAGRLALFQSSAKPADVAEGHHIRSAKAALKASAQPQDGGENG